MKHLIRTVAGRFNVLLADKSRIGIELENDIGRLSHSNPVRVIFDVGANHGQSAMRFARAFPEAKIYSFEPVPSNFEIFLRRCARNPKIELVRKGLGKMEAEAVIGLADSPGRHSLLLGSSSTRTETISLTTLDLFVENRGLRNIDLLKIDVEGLEMDVLEGATESLRDRRIRFLYAECIFDKDPSAPHTMFSDLRDCLSNYGFALFACYHESFNLKAGSAMGNVLFVNRALLPGSVTGRVRNIF